jgi:ABC-type phosphate transport system substrate-binding protein
MMRALLLIFGILWAWPSQAEGLLVIASPQVPDNAISLKQLAEIYALKKDYWANKIQVVPVNREAASAERGRFSEAVFNMSPQDLTEYWNRLSFQGDFPPLVQTSDDAVLGFVRSVPGAIGYINANINQQPTGVKILLRLH